MGKTRKVACSPTTDCIPLEPLSKVTYKSRNFVTALVGKVEFAHLLFAKFFLTINEWGDV